MLILYKNARNVRFVLQYLRKPREIWINHRLYSYPGTAVAETVFPAGKLLQKPIDLSCAKVVKLLELNWFPMERTEKEC